MDDRLQALQRRLQTLRAGRQTSDPALQQPVEPRERLRGEVTRYVISAYLIVVVGIVGWLVLLVNDVPTSEKFSMALDVVKVAILPVVTFVIGHYFGSQSK